MSRNTRMNIPIVDSHEEETMHLIDVEAREEEALCGKDSSCIERMSVGYYLEERLRRRPVGTVCQDCKGLAMPLAEAIIEDMAQALEEEGRLGDADDCCELLKRLARESGPDRGPDWGAPICAALFTL